ncbi:MAG TPA: peroxiredoxin [Alphaproteobacteria bacterium]|nr:peroxiredoxin [Alphaproteobacteria bacterium]
MTIKVGDKVPAGKVKYMGADGKPAELSTDDLFKGKKVVLFGLPGAFTPTCSAKHVPGFVQQAGALKAKGVATIACISVNDAFVMGAWGKDQGSGDKVMMLADGSADFTKALGLEQDLSAAGLGVRSKRYAMIVEDGTVKWMGVEDAPGKLEHSGADQVLAHL